MAEPVIPNNAGPGQPDPLADDPKLRELIENYKRASEELTAYLQEKCNAAGLKLPE